MDRSGNRALVESLGGGIVGPTRERTLYIEGVPRPENKGEDEWPCDYVAVSVLRAACEQSCTRIVVRKPWRGHSCEFDVATMLREIADYWGGTLPGPPPGPVLPGLATAKQLALGGEMAPHRPLVTVPTAISSTAGSEEKPT